MHFQQQAAGFRLERSVIRAGRPTGVGVGRKRLAPLTFSVVADDEVARNQINLLPVIVDEGSGREDTWCKSQQARARAAFGLLIERAGQDLLLNSLGVARRRLPAGAHVEGVELPMLFVHGHGDDIPSLSTGVTERSRSYQTRARGKRPRDGKPTHRGGCSAPWRGSYCDREPVQPCRQ